MSTWGLNGGEESVPGVTIFNSIEVYKSRGLVGIQDIERRMVENKSGKARWVWPGIVSCINVTISSC